MNRINQDEIDVPIKRNNNTFNNVIVFQGENNNNINDSKKVDQRIRKAKTSPNIYGSYTEQDIENLNKFKEYCASMGLEYRFDLYKSDLLLRLLKSKNYNIPATYQMFIEYIRFAEQFDLFNVRNVRFPNFDKIKLFYPHGFHKTTIEGNPIFIQMLGELKVDDINRILPEPLLTQYILLKLDELEKDIFPKCTEYYKKNISQVFCIIDLLGLSTSLMNKKVLDFILKQMNICQKCFPGLLDYLYFVNTSLVFRSIWYPCKYIYEAGTRDKIKLLPFEYKNELLKKIYPENLPKFFGGSCNCDPYGCLFSNSGPWNKTVSAAEKRRNTDYLQKLILLNEEKEKKEKEMNIDNEINDDDIEEEEKNNDIHDNNNNFGDNINNIHENIDDKSEQSSDNNIENNIQIEKKSDVDKSIETAIHNSLNINALKNDKNNNIADKSDYEEDSSTNTIKSNNLNQKNIK